MMSMPLGALVMAGVLVLILANPETNIKAFANVHSIVLVFAGTLAILGISSPMSSIRSVGSVLRLLIRPETSNEGLNQALIELSKRRGASVQVNHPLIAYVQGLWEQGLDADTVQALMRQRMDQLNREAETAVVTVRNLAKYPPALGMTGTVLGMISLFANLTAESRGKIGPQLALAMTATFYGLILANVVLMPLADRIQVIHHEESKRNKHVFKILTMIQQEQPASVIRDEVYGKAA